MNSNFNLLLLTCLKGEVYKHFWTKQKVWAVRERRMLEWEAEVSPEAVIESYRSLL